VLAGIGIGVCFTVYYAARLAPALALLFVAYCALRRRDFLRLHLRRLAIIPVVAFLFLAPSFPTFIDHPTSFMSRTTEVSLLSPGPLKHELDAYRVSTLNDVLYIQAKNTLTAFNLTGESSLQYQHKDALLDFWTGSLLVLGVLLMALRLDEPRHLLFGSWIVATLLIGSVLTVDAPFSPRLVAVIPPLMLPPALVLDAGWRGASRLLRRQGRLLMALLTAAVLGLSALANYRDYFIRHVTELQPAGYYTTLAHFIEPLNSRYRVYYLNEDGHPADYVAITFLLPNLDVVADRQSPLHVPLRQNALPGDKGALFIVDTHIPDFDTRLAQIVRAYPSGQKQTVSVVGGGDVFVAYQVEPDALRAAAQP
jgi:hypothetical protein